ELDPSQAIAPRPDQCCNLGGVEMAEHDDRIRGGKRVGKFVLCVDATEIDGEEGRKLFREIIVERTPQQDAGWHVVSGRQMDKVGWMMSGRLGQVIGLQYPHNNAWR